MKTAFIPLAMVAILVSLSACTKTPFPVEVEPATQAPAHARTLDTTRHMTVPLNPEIPRVPKGDGI